MFPKVLNTDLWCTWIRFEANNQKLWKHRIWRFAGVMWIDVDILIFHIFTGHHFFWKQMETRTTITRTEPWSRQKIFSGCLRRRLLTWTVLGMRLLVAFSRRRSSRAELFGCAPSPLRRLKHRKVDRPSLIKQDLVFCWWRPRIRFQIGLRCKRLCQTVFKEALAFGATKSFWCILLDTTSAQPKLIRWFLCKQNPLILLFHLSALICALCSSPMIIRRSWKCCHDPAQWRLYFASHSKNGWACCALLGNRILLNKTITATATSLYSSALGSWILISMDLDDWIF